MNSKGEIVFSTEMQSWDADDPSSEAHGEKWTAEVAVDGTGSRLTVFLTDAMGRSQEIGIEINGRQIGLQANTDIHFDAPLLAAKIGQNEAYVYDMLGTGSSDSIIKADANGFSRADRMEFTDVPRSAPGR